MDHAWIGARLVQAAEALTERFLEDEAAPRPSPLAPLAASFLRELGAALAQGGTDTTRPFRRAHGVLRLPAAGDPIPALREFVRLDRLVREHLAQLPGYTREMDHFLRDAGRHALQTAAHIYAALAAGVRTERERAFGGVVTLEYPPPGAAASGLAPP